MSIPFAIAAASLVFWGAQTGLLALALAAAAALLLSERYPKKIDFTVAQLNKITDVCSVTVAAAIVLFISSEPESALKNTLRLMPLFSLPLLLAQGVSQSRVTNIKALFLFQRKSRSYGPDIFIDLAYPFALLCFISAGTANNRSPVYYLGAVLVCLAALAARRSKKCSPAFFLTVFLLAAGFGYGLQHGLVAVQEALTRMTLELFLADYSDPFRRTTAIGDIGRLKLRDTILFRVRPEAPEKPSYLIKEASYNVYANNAWFAPHAGFSPISPDPDGAFTLDSGTKPDRFMTVIQRLRRGSGLLKLPENAVRLENPDLGAIETNRFGAVFTQDATEHIITRIGFSSSTNTRPSEPDKNDLIVPPDLTELFSSLAADIHSPSGTDALDDKQLLSAVTRYFDNGFAYTLNLSLNQGKSPLTRFMTQTKKGHCEYFATATVFFLRAAGIPARYVSGFLAFENSLFEPGIVVRMKHAHAWTEAYIDGRWIFVDTTPASWPEEEETSFLLTLLPDLFSFLADRLAILRWHTPDLQKKVLWLLVPLAWIIIRRLLRDRKKREPDEPPADTEPPWDPSAANAAFAIHRLEDKLAALGYPRMAHESFRAFLTRVCEDLYPVLNRDLIEAVIRRHNRLRFGNEPMNDTEIRQLEQDVQIISKRLDSAEPVETAPGP